MTRISVTLLPLALLVLLVAGGLTASRAFAFTDQQVQQVFALLDSNQTGKVDKAEYDQNKVGAMFWQSKTGAVGIGELSYEDTQFNRAFFDAADTDHKGRLDGVDMIYALEFENIDTDRKGYITLDDLRRFMKKIGR
jgi:Ca2+-binding EF-hand superfamily protein